MRLQVPTLCGVEGGPFWRSQGSGRGPGAPDAPGASRDPPFSYREVLTQCGSVLEALLKDPKNVHAVYEEVLG